MHIFHLQIYITVVGTLVYNHHICYNKLIYYYLQPNLQIQYSALLDDGTLCACDFKSGSVFIEEFYHIKATTCVCMQQVKSGVK